MTPFPDYYNLYLLPTLQLLTTVYTFYLRHVTCGDGGRGMKSFYLLTLSLKEAEW